MSTFDLRAFSVGMLAEALFYDEEFGAIGSVSLVNESERKELFISYYLAEESKFVIDKVTAWEDDEVEEEEAIGYLLAVDSDEHMAADSQDKIAMELLSLAEEHNLTPSVSLFFEDDSE